jgi:hypothetical protein
MNYASPGLPGAYLGTATNPERGHSCPQQRACANRLWNTNAFGWYSELAADRNVRAPMTMPRRATQRGAVKVMAE